MSAELDAKWAKLVKAGRAKWAPGMLWWHSKRAFERYELADGQRPIEHGAAPDWSDDATLGALLGQVREAHDDWSINSVCVSDLGPANGWRCWPAQGVYPTEAAALLAAREAAP